MKDVCKKVEVFLNRAARFIAVTSNKIADRQIVGNTAHMLSQQVVDLQHAVDSLRDPFNDWTDKEKLFVVDTYTAHLKLMNYGTSTVECFTKQKNPGPSCNENATICEVLDLITDRYLDLKDTDNSFIGRAFQVPVVSEHEDKLTFTDAFTITRNTTWSDLLSKQRAGNVKVWDRYIIIDQFNRPIFIVNQSPDGKSWFNEVDNNGVEVLRHLDDGSIPLTMPTMHSLSWRNDVSTLQFSKGESLEVSVEYRDNGVSRTFLNAQSPLQVALIKDYTMHTIQARVKGTLPSTPWSSWIEDTVPSIPVVIPTGLTIDVNETAHSITFSWSLVPDSIGYMLNYGFDNDTNPIPLELTTNTKTIYYGAIAASGMEITWEVKTKYTDTVFSNKAIGPATVLPESGEPSIETITWDESNNNVNITSKEGDYTALEISYTVDSGVPVVVPNAPTSMYFLLYKTATPQTVRAKVRGTAPGVTEFSAEVVYVLVAQGQPAIDLLTYQYPDILKINLSLGDYNKVDVETFVDGTSVDLKENATNQILYISVPTTSVDQEATVKIRGAEPTEGPWSGLSSIDIPAYIAPQNLLATDDPDNSRIKLTWDAAIDAYSYTVFFDWNGGVDQASSPTTNEAYIPYPSSSGTLHWKVKTNYTTGESIYVSGADYNYTYVDPITAPPTNLRVSYWEEPGESYDYINCDWALVAGNSYDYELFKNNISIATGTTELGGIEETINNPSLTDEFYFNLIATEVGKPPSISVKSNTITPESKNYLSNPKNPITNYQGVDEDDEHGVECLCDSVARADSYIWRIYLDGVFFEESTTPTGRKVSYPPETNADIEFHFQVKAVDTTDKYNPSDFVTSPSITLPAKPTL